MTLILKYNHKYFYIILKHINKSTKEKNKLKKRVQMI